MKAKATFAAGCFWGVEATFDKIPGVLATRVGYTGGHTANPTYEQVCTGTTGHAEAVEVTFDPQIISYERLLDTFWQCHDPTSLYKQGADIGRQYRSAIFFHNAEQEAIANAAKKAQQSHFSEPVVTEIKPLTTFYQAEQMHQKYLAKKSK